MDSDLYADSKYVISFDTHRSLLVELCKIPVKKQKIRTQGQCAWVFKWRVFFLAGKMYGFVAIEKGYRMK